LRVEVDPDLYAKAEIEFATGDRPDYNDFCLGPLAAVVFTCETGQVRAHPLPDFPGIFTTVLPVAQPPFRGGRGQVMDLEKAKLAAEAASVELAVASRNQQIRSVIAAGMTLREIEADSATDA